MKCHIHNNSCFFDTKIQGNETSVSHQITQLHATNCERYSGISKEQATLNCDLVTP